MEKYLTIMLVYIVLLSCTANKVSTTSSSLMINYESPNISIDHKFIINNEQKYVQLGIEIINNPFYYTNDLDSLVEYNISIVVYSNANDILINDSKQITINKGKHKSKTIINYPISGIYKKCTVSIDSKQFSESKTYNFERQYNQNQEIGDVSVGIYDSSNKWDPFISYTNNLQNNIPIYYSLSSLRDTIVRIEIKKYKADESHARYIHQNQYNTTSLEYKGVDYNDYVVICDTIVRVNSSEFVAKTPFLDTGNYEINVLHVTDDEKAKSTSKKIFSVYRSKLNSVKKQIEPFVYIYPDKQWKKIVDIEDEKLIMNDFLSYFKNNNIALTEIKEMFLLYQRRVNESDFFFTNYKEGWKTDMGMMYIIYGPPLFMMKKYDSIYWYYTHNPTDTNRIFEFKRVRLNSEYFPFDQYILRRNSNYFQINYSRIQDWRTAAILKYDRF